MRALFPSPAEDLSDEALMHLYAWPQAPAPGHRQPWVRMNFAASLDGAVSGAGGKSASISGPADKHVFALLRASSDVVMAGAGTARVEGYGPVIVRPSLAGLRAQQGRNRPPALALVTDRADLDPAAPMFTEAVSRTIVISHAAAPPDKVAALRKVADVLLCGETAVDLTLAAAELAKRGNERVLCEGGPRLFSSLLDAELVDDICLTISPLLVGGQTSSVHGPAHDPARITGGPIQLPASVPAELATVIAAGSTLLTRWTIPRTT